MCVLPTGREPCYHRGCLTPWAYPVPSTGLDQRRIPERSAGGVVWLRYTGLSVPSEEEIPVLGPLVLGMAILEAVCAPGRPSLLF